MIEFIPLSSNSLEMDLTPTFVWQQVTLSPSLPSLCIRMSMVLASPCIRLSENIKDNCWSWTVIQTNIGERKVEPYGYPNSKANSLPPVPGTIIGEKVFKFPSISSCCRNPLIPRNCFFSWLTTYNRPNTL